MKRKDERKEEDDPEEKGKEEVENRKGKVKEIITWEKKKIRKHKKKRVGKEY